MKSSNGVGFSRRGQANSTVLIVDTKPLKDSTRQRPTSRVAVSSTPYFHHCMTTLLALLLGTPPLLRTVRLVTKLAPGTESTSSTLHLVLRI